jgi:N-acyl-D-amino-acid deacylase
MARFDLLIEGGTVVDGTGMPRFVGDVGIENGTISAIERDISAGSANRVIDACGRIVAPGAVDIHSHFDAQIHWDPYCTPNSWHGFTTQVVTNCGFGFAPCRPNMRQRYMRMMETTEQINYNASEAVLSWDWETFPQWMEHMRRLPKGVNIVQYFPLNPALCYVMGPEEAKKRPASQKEFAQLADMLNRAMDAGACGFSFTHLNNTSSHTDFDGTPMPTDVHPPEDFYKLAEVLKTRGQGMIQALLDLPGIFNGHIAEEMARVSGRRVLHNAAGPYDGQPEFHQRVLKWLTECERKGLDIYSFSQGRPLTSAQFSFEDNNLIEAVPFFRQFSKATKAEKRRMASDPQFLESAKAAYDPVVLAGNNMLFEEMVLVNPGKASEFARFKGKTMSEISRDISSDVTDTVFRIVAESDVDAEFKTFLNKEIDGFRDIWAHPRVLISGTDGGAHLKLTALGDCPTETINIIVKEEGITSLENAHFRLSNMPARVMGLHNRGALLEGYAADLMIYDFDTVGSTRTFEKIRDMPDGSFRLAQRATGVDWVVVNGQPIFEKGSSQGALPGRLVSNGGREMDEKIRGNLPL